MEKQKAILTTDIVLAFKKDNPKGSVVAGVFNQSSQNSYEALGYTRFVKVAQLTGATITKIDDTYHFEYEGIKFETIYKWLFVDDTERNRFIIQCINYQDTVIDQAREQKIYLTNLLTLSLNEDV